MGIRWMVLFLALALAAGYVACQPKAAPAPGIPVAPLQILDPWETEMPGEGQGCTTVYATDGLQMWGGNNEDSREPLTKVWFVPATQDTFGLVLFGYSNYRAQGGMNDQGLFFDFLSVSQELPIRIEGKQPYTGTNFIVYDAMAQCASVACAVDMFETYYDAEAWSMQVFFGDATGESAIVEPQTILRQQGSYQVATNFYQSTIDPQNRADYDRRYKTASEMLATAPALSADLLRDVMAAVHQEGSGSQTVYTNVYDLAHRLVYLYYFHDYAHVAVIDLAAELAKGTHAYDIAALFPPNPTAQAFNEPALKDYQRATHAQRVEIDPAFLAAYIGEYAPLDTQPPKPGEWVTVVPYGTSLMMIFPDSHRYELFPQSETNFYVIAWDKQYERFNVPFYVHFGLEAATGQVLSMDFVFGSGGDSVRNDRLSPAAFVPYLPERSPASQAGGTSIPAAALTATSYAQTSPAPAAKTGFPAWGWAFLPLVLLAAAAGWALVRRSRSARRKLP